MANKMSKTMYIFVLIAIEMCSAAVFYWFMPKYALHISKVKVSSYLLFSVLVLVTLVPGVLTSIARERNIRNVFLICVYPVALYFDIFCWKSVKFWGIILVSSLLIIALTNKISRNIRLSTIADDSNYMAFRRRSRYIIIQIVLLVVLLVIAAVGYLNTFGISDKIIWPVIDKLQDEDLTDIELPTYQQWNDRDEEKMLRNQIEDISLFYNWKACSKQEKKRALMALLNVETRYLGVEDCKVTVKKLNDDVLYNAKEDCIYIDKNFYENTSDGYSVIGILCQGIYQKYMSMEVDFYKKIYKDKSFWKYVHMNLFDRLILYNDKTGKIQKEEDSIAYAKKCTENYKATIEAYRKKSKETSVLSH